MDASAAQQDQILGNIFGHAGGFIVAPEAAGLVVTRGAEAAAGLANLASYAANVGRRVLADTSGFVPRLPAEPLNATANATAAAEGGAPEINVLFGQKRVGPTFGVDGRPDYLAGRTISDVASDLRSGALHPDQLPIDAFRYFDDLVSANTRSLSALSEAGLRPTVVNEIQPTSALLSRLRETPIISNAPLPGQRVPVTPSQSNLDVLRIIKLAK